jgi:hypothetical protein
MKWPYIEKVAAKRVADDAGTLRDALRRVPG